MALAAALVPVESHGSDLVAVALGHQLSSASALEAGPAQHVADSDPEPRKALRHSEQFGTQMLSLWAVKEASVEVQLGSVAAEALKQQAAGEEGWVSDQEGLDLLPSELVSVQLC